MVPGALGEWPVVTSLHLDAQLESILSEDLAAARTREQAAFDKAAGSFAQSLVLYGAGKLGRKVLRGLRENGLDALAFADANASLFGKNIDGVPVLSPEAATQKYGAKAAFVVSVWHPDPQSGVRNIGDGLAAMGARFVTSFAQLFWKYAKTFLPHYFWDLPSNLLAHQAEIRQAYQLFREETSKAQFVSDLELRTHGRFRERVPCMGSQYFPSDLFRVSPQGCFVDCGAYDGDTIREIVSESNGRVPRIVAFEADPANFSRLRDYVAIQPELYERVTLHRAAVARERGTLRFAATAGSDAAVSDGGETVVDCVRLDDVLGAETPTMIKMDIEGSELDALEGAVRLISSHEPLLAVCVYHRPDHLWKIPLWLKNAEPSARLHLRSYSVDGFDSVCYAVPAARALQTEN